MSDTESDMADVATAKPTAAGTIGRVVTEVSAPATSRPLPEDIYDAEGKPNLDLVRTCVGTPKLTQEPVLLLHR